MGDEGCLSASSLVLRWVSLFTTVLRCLAESMTMNEQKIELPLKSIVWRSLPISCYFPPRACISASASSPLPGPIAEGGLGVCMENTFCRERWCLPQPGKTGSSWSSKSFLWSRKEAGTFATWRLWLLKKSSYTWKLVFSVSICWSNKNLPLYWCKMLSLLLSPFFFFFF